MPRESVREHDRLYPLGERPQHRADGRTRGDHEEGRHRARLAILDPATLPAAADATPTTNDRAR